MGFEGLGEAWLEDCCIWGAVMGVEGLDEVDAASGGGLDSCTVASLLALAVWL